MTIHPSDPPAAPSNRASDAAPYWRFAFTGQGSEYFGIAFLNFVLNAVTLGVWFAWGRIRELTYLIGHVRVSRDDPAGGRESSDDLSFHGRGGELFRGVLLAFFLLILPMYLLFFFAIRSADRLDFGLMALGYVFVFLLVGFASVGSLRYRLPRTQWRGIRFGFRGRTQDFLLPFLLRIVLVVVSLGLAYPIYASWRRRWMLEHSRFGDAPFEFWGTADPLYGRFLLCWLLFFPTLGFAWIYYQGYQQAYFWSRTAVAGARFSSSMTGTGWLGLQVVNSILLFFTFGIAMPWVVTRTHRYFFEHLSLAGTLDLRAIHQSRQKTSGIGEGALDILDMDSGLDLG